jgi:hypothetical protein
MIALVDDEQARVLDHEGNVAVVLLPGRAFPGVHLQGDIFAVLRRHLADVARRLSLLECGGEGAGRTG